MKITDSQVVAACQIAKRVFDGQMKKAEGIALLTSDHGLNEATAGDFINDYKYLLEGKVFHRAMSAPAMRYFIEQIAEDRGERGQANAVKGLRAHIEYYEGHYKTTMHAMRSVADDFEVMHKSSRTKDELENDLLKAVEISSQRSQEERLRRLASASTKPSKLIVQSTVFIRNPDVIAQTLLRAAGKCEECKSDAPFRRKRDGTPYLEVHHRVRLANGGQDSVENAVAICPNCHRRSHYGVAGA